MSTDVFQQTLRAFLRREPFEQFVIELVDGRQLLIDLPHTVALGTSRACFMTPDYEFHSFTCDEVRDIRAATPETAS